MKNINLKFNIDKNVEVKDDFKGTIIEVRFYVEKYTSVGASSYERAGRLPTSQHAGTWSTEIFLSSVPSNAKIVAH